MFTFSLGEILRKNEKSGIIKPKPAAEALLF